MGTTRGVTALLSAPSTIKGRTIKKRIAGGGGGGGKEKKKNSRKGKLNEKQFMHAN